MKKITYFSKDFNLDASSDALLLEGDKDLELLREVNDRYGSREFLVMTYEPNSSFEKEDTIIDLQFLKSKIEKLSWVDQVITLADIPLLKSTDEPLMDRLKNYKTLSYPEIDKKRGLQEILESPIFKDYIISADGKTSAIVVYLKKDERLDEFINQKNNYLKLFNNKESNKIEKGKYKTFLNYLYKNRVSIFSFSSNDEFENT